MKVADILEIKGSTVITIKPTETMAALRAGDAERLYIIFETALEDRLKSLASA